jgi:hypothetical protein
MSAAPRETADANRSTPELAGSDENATEAREDWWDSTEWREDTAAGQKMWTERQNQGPFRIAISSQTVSSLSEEDITNACWDVLTNEGWTEKQLEGITLQMGAAKGDGKGGSEGRSDLLVGGPSSKSMRDVGHNLRELLKDGRAAQVTLEDRQGKGRPFDGGYNNKRGRGGHSGKGARQQRNGTAAWSENWNEGHKNQRQW